MRTGRHRTSNQKWSGIFATVRCLSAALRAKPSTTASRISCLPVFISDIPQLFTSGQLPLDVAMLNVSPPDRHGFCSLGTSVDCAPLGQEAGNAFSGGTQRQVVAYGEQDDLAWEAMA